MQHTSKIFEIGKPDRNGRIYSKECMDEAIKKYSEKIKDNRAVGCLGAIQTPNIVLTDISHKVTNIYESNNEVYATLETLNTPQGKIAAMLPNASVVTRGIGTIVKGKVENYELISIDIVPMPLTPQNKEGQWDHIDYLDERN